MSKGLVCQPALLQHFSNNCNTHQTITDTDPACAAGLGQTACKFAEKVWNAQEAGAQAVSHAVSGLAAYSPCLHPLLCMHPCFSTKLLLDVVSSSYASDLQVIVVNYEDSHTTMEAPDEDDESAYK